MLKYFARSLCRILPETRLFRLKRQLWRLTGAHIEENVRICSSARFITNGDLKIGSGTWVGHEVLVVGGRATVIIGKNSDIAPRVTMATGTHEVLVGRERAAGNGYSLDIEIGDGCWIGTGAVILGGSKIGDCCLVAAGAVVKGEFPERSLIGGVPAKVLRKLVPSLAQ